MATLGFRRPQFSEDLAWLPAWLQHQGAKPSLQHAKDSQTLSEQLFKDSPLVGNVAEKTETDFCSKEGQYNSCHLFLSGEDNSPIGFAQPPANVLQFHLHLSSDPDSQCGRSQICHVSKAQSNSSKDISVERVVNSVASEEICKSKINCQAGRVRTLETMENDVSPQTIPNERSKRRKLEGKSAVRGLKSADVSDAVEFSIAASEALVIHELVKDESALESLPAAAVLEVSLQVKQARLERLEVCHSPVDEVDESDFLSELDDLTMSDVFEDVGLSFSVQDDHCLCGSDVSQVKETPLSGNGTCDNEGKHEEFLDHQVGFDNLSRKKQSGDVQGMDMDTVKDTPLESHQCESRKEFSDNLALGSNSSNVAGCVDPMVHHLVYEKTKTNPTPRGGSPSMIDASSVQPLSDINSSLAWNFESPKVDKVSSPAPERYKSRWLGGWSTKEVDTSVQLQRNGTKRVSNFFLLQSSFLSESAEIAPDESSCMQKHQTSSASQSSIPFEGLCDQDNEGVLLSQDGVRFCSPFVDPLCSVVPCSIPSQHAESLVAKNQNSSEHENNTNKCCSPSSRLGMKKMQNISDLKGDCPYVDRQAAPTNGDDCAEPRIERRFTSLKTYSTLLPNHNTHNPLFPLRCGQTLLCLDQNLGSTRYSHERNYEGSEPFRDISDYRVVRDNEENHETTITAHPVSEAATLKRNNEEDEKDEAEGKNQLMKERGAPIILNHRKRLCLQACENSVENSTTEESPEQIVVPESSVELQNRKSLLRIPSEQNNPCAAQVPRRKCVRFLEAEVKFKKKGSQKLSSSHKTSYVGSTSRTGKRLKYSHPELESQTRDLRRHLTTCWGKDGKTLIFQGVQFLLTGFSRKKQKEIEGLIHEYGGIVLYDIPSLNSRRKRNMRSKFLQLPVVLCSKKLQTTNFLYGCAVDTFILKLSWLTDSIAASSIEAPEKYMILPNHGDVRRGRIGKPVCRDYHKPIFEGVGIMLHGKPSFCTKLAQIIKHGDGMVFKTLHMLVQSLDTEKISVGVIVAENEGRASRHLRHCALERKIPMMPSSWIIKSLHSGKLLPLPEDRHSSPSSTITVPEIVGSMSEEI